MWRWIDRFLQWLLPAPPKAERKLPSPSPRPQQYRPVVWAARPVPQAAKLDGKGPSWIACHPRTRARFKAEMICSRGHRLVLTNHRIKADGSVFPSVVCRTRGCTYHEVVRLVDWDGGELS